MRSSAVLATLPRPFGRSEASTTPVVALKPLPAVQEAAQPKTDTSEGPEQLRPLMKWVGSKRRLAATILPLLPDFKGTYWEPMCGGAAIFCALLAAGRLKGQPVVLSDLNQELMGLLRTVKERPELLIARLLTYQAEYAAASHEERLKLYLRERERWNSGPKGRTAARFIFLKQTAFNGLWRVNRKGHMNVGWGKYETPNFLDHGNIMSWHKALQRVDLWVGSAIDVCEPQAGDLVYLDPPYAGTFGGYTADGFTEAHQRDLLKKVGEWTRAGAFVAYSNSLAVEPILDELWPQGKRHRLTTSYVVNCDGAGRKPVEELLVVQGPRT
jgi:DNA adenine methylase